VLAAFGLFLLADNSERSPPDRGAIKGLYSFLLAFGHIVGSLIGGVVADMRGIDGLLIATLGLLLLALGPLALLRRQEHHVGSQSEPAFDLVEPELDPLP
jgi:predicted MFS family arabinose efflux permease